MDLSRLTSSNGIERIDKVKWRTGLGLWFGFVWIRRMRWSVPETVMSREGAG